MSKSREDLYRARFTRVFEYIDRHLDEPLSVEGLSEIAHFSKFHFHRQFSDYCGISVMRYIQVVRLRRASHQLVFSPQERITDIALNAGFENPESFSRAFKSAFGQTPSDFRKQPQWQPWRERFQFPERERTIPMEVKIISFEQTSVAALEHRGPPERVNDSALQFIEWRKHTGLSPVQSSRTFGVAYDDPETTAPDQFRFDICGEVAADVPPNPQGVINKVIPAGRCAVLRHFGSHDQLRGPIYHLYRDWLPASGEQLRDFPLFFHYVNLITDTPEHELVTDIYLPLK